MPSSDEPPREPDSLAGSPELFATNLLLVRAIDNEIDRILIERSPGEITVQLVDESRDYDPETLTEDLDHWDAIVERFQDYTRPDKDASGEGTILEPNIPAADNVEEIRIKMSDNQLDIVFDH